MAWLAFDSAVRLVERFELDAPLARWKQIRTRIHRQVIAKGYDQKRKTFTQYYGSRELDAAVLMIPIVGFLPGTDERVTGTIDALQHELGQDGSISRYSTTATDDGLPGTEAQFLACSFWLVTALAMNGRADEGRQLSSVYWHSATTWDCSPRSTTSPTSDGRPLGCGSCPL
jgi:GH15 family glucan-1,4-alpha-glucosidase